MDYIKEFMEDESGMGTVEIVLIIIVLVGLVIAFREGISGIVENIMQSIQSKTSSFN